jgi:hypothetical protein
VLRCGCLPHVTGVAAASWLRWREMARLLCRPVLGDGAGTGSAPRAGLPEDFGRARTGAGQRRGRWRCRGAWPGLRCCGSGEREVVVSYSDAAGRGSRSGRVSAV